MLYHMNSHPLLPTVSSKVFGFACLHILPVHTVVTLLGILHVFHFYYDRMNYVIQIKPSRITIEMYGLIRYR